MTNAIRYRVTPQNDLMQLHEGREVGVLGVRLAPDTASLFAAAPDMLEALGPFASFACDEPHVGEPECHNCIARAAIAKATQA